MVRSIASNVFGCCTVCSSFVSCHWKTYVPSPCTPLSGAPWMDHSSDYPRLAINPGALELGAPFKPLFWIFRLRLLGGYCNASSNHHSLGENGCHQLPIRRTLSRSVLGSKQSSFHRVKIALGNPLTCWSLRFPFSCHALVHSQSFDLEV